MIIEFTDEGKNVVFEDSERMKLEAEIYGPVAQLHFTPYKWSPKQYKLYKKILAHWENVLRDEGVKVILEFFLPESTDKIKLTKMFGFTEVQFEEELPEPIKYVCLGKIL